MESLLPEVQDCTRELGCNDPVVTAGGRLHVVSDELLFSPTSMDAHVFENVLSICDGDDNGAADTSSM